MTLSVVTCCMNRNDHLARTIPQWLDRAWVDDVVIVDWSSTQPVAETLRDVPKDKIRIIRAEGEANWVLTLAYNLGVLHARGDTILKIDADCHADDTLFTACRPDDAVFHAGNWRNGFERGKGASVNGQCLFTRRAFEAVNGFHELLRGWGHDDEDFYTRLQAKGWARKLLNCDQLDFIDHSHEHRLANTPQKPAGRSAQDWLERQVLVLEWKNRAIAEQMPWGPWFPRARYRRLSVEGAVTRVERVRALDIKIPQAVTDFAWLDAGRKALRALNIDTGQAVPVDYASVLDLFETWLQANATPLAA